MDRRDIVVIGSSAGGVSTLRELASRLPADLQAAVFVVNHVPADYESVLPGILSSAGPLPALHPHDGQLVEHGHIYVAPPNHHILLQEEGKITLSTGPRENRHRPAIDALFRTAARTYGARTIAVILSGTLDDGAVGLLTVQMQGGLTIIQDPAEAVFPQMPQSALALVADVDFVAPVAEISRLIMQHVEHIVGEQEVEMRHVHTQKKGHGGSKAREAYPDLTDLDKAMEGAEISTSTCPECGGVLWDLSKGEGRIYRCHTGHTFGTLSLLAAQSQAVEEALWSAVRALKEKASIAESGATQVAKGELLQEYARHYHHEAEQANKQAKIIQELLLGGKTEIPDVTPPIDNLGHEQHRT